MDKLHAMADALMRYETISLKQIEDIMAGRPVRSPEDEDGGTDTTGGTGNAADSGDQSSGAAGGVVGGPVGEH